jgi:hypothetical protein
LEQCPGVYEPKAMVLEFIGFRNRFRVTTRPWPAPLVTTALAAHVRAGRTLARVE